MGSTFADSDAEMVEFRITKGRSRAKSRITTLGFRRAVFELFKDLSGAVPQETALERSTRKLINIQESLQPSSRLGVVSTDL